MLKRFAVATTLLAAVCGLSAPAAAAPVTYTFNATSFGNDFYHLVSATGYVTFDTSLFTPDTPGFSVATFQTASVTNVTAFDFVFVTDVMGTDVTQEFTLASLQAGSGWIFEDNTNPPSFFDGTGPDEVATDSLNAALTMSLHIADFGGEGNAQLALGGEYDEEAYGSFTANAVSTPTDGVPEPITLSIFGAGLAGAAAMRRRKAKV